MSLKLSLPKEILLLALILSGSCTKDFDPRQQSYPLIKTATVTNIDEDGAQFNGLVIKDGTDPVIDFGFKYVERPDSLYKTVADTFSVSMGNDFEKYFSIKMNHNLLKNLSYNVMAFASTDKKTVIGNAVIFKSRSTSPIQITSFSPDHVLDGDTLIIFGENFNRYGSDLVQIDTKLVIDALNYDNKSVTVVVPPITKVGPVNVAVDAFYSNTNSDLLIVINPSISSFLPTHGTAGTVVTLNGRFSSNVNYNKILFNNAIGTITYSSKNQIKVKLPAGLTGNVSVTIDVNGKTFTTADPLFVE
jgi:hypothetical protein